MSKRFTFVVDTDQYSGNFERQLCGFLVGKTDDPVTHGDVEAEIAAQELQPDEWDFCLKHVISCHEQVDDGWKDTPVVIRPTPGWWNNGMGGHFKEGQEEEGYAHYKKEVEQYNANYPTANLQIHKLTKFPAYMSVAVFFDEDPPQKIIDMLKDRAQEFADVYWPNQRWSGGKISISGFRLLEERYGQAEVLNSRNV